MPPSTLTTTGDVATPAPGQANGMNAIPTDPAVQGDIGHGYAQARTWRHPYFGVAGGYDLTQPKAMLFSGRVVAGVDGLAGPLGVRARIDVGRDGGVGKGAIGFGVDLPLSFEAANARFYVAPGGGYQVALSNLSHNGFYAGLLAGSDIPLNAHVSAFVEGGADYDLSQGFSQPMKAIDGTLVVGMKLR